ncbi:MAG: glycerol-3-phosphate 1-O-acyltransferase PlsY [Eubacteriaceae bacterium]|nr:glycerol-3-phosphate 1-O-acyltransferase PlsY [Eubacteriaceae bacterium]
MDKFLFALAIVIAYFLGNISPSTFMAKLQGKDIKKEGSGNAGTTNALRVLGKKAAIITLVIDVGKGFVAVVLGGLIAGPTAALWCGLASFAGHIWPVLLRFKGGKGVAIACGILLAVNWKLALVLIAVFVSVILLTRMVSLGSITAAVCFPLLSYFMERDFLVVGFIMAVILIYKHKANIIRIVKGEENKISF